MTGRYGLPMNQIFSKIIYLITMLLPYISIIFLWFFRYHYFANNMHMHLVSTLLLYTDYPTSTPNPKKPSWWRPKGWNASRATPDKITTTTMSFYASVLLPSCITNRNHCSLVATISPHSTMSFHLFFTPTTLLINTTLYFRQIWLKYLQMPTVHTAWKESCGK